MSKCKKQEILSNITLTTEAPQSMRIDQTDANNVYQGWSKVGSQESDEVWRIRLITTVGGLVSIKWANGNLNYENQWSTRGNITYI